MGGQLKKKMKRATKDALRWPHFQGAREKKKHRKTNKSNTKNTRSRTK